VASVASIKPIVEALSSQGAGRFPLGL